MVTASILALSLTSLQAPSPVLWMNFQGQILVNGEEVNPVFNPGASRYRSERGICYSFSGGKGGILFGDTQVLALQGSISVAAWINPKAWVTDGPGAQILFRGDDRNGLDPYYLTIHPDGTVNFAINDEQQQGMSVKTELQLGKWQHILASFDAKTGIMRMWLNGEEVANAITTRRPFKVLDNKFAPGFSVGNVQNNQGPHNQPFTGFLGDIRIYNTAVTPDDIFDTIRPWNVTPQVPTN